MAQQIRTTQPADTQPIAPNALEITCWPNPAAQQLNMECSAHIDIGSHRQLPLVLLGNNKAGDHLIIISLHFLFINFQGIRVKSLDLHFYLNHICSLVS